MDNSKYNRAYEIPDCAKELGISFNPIFIRMVKINILDKFTF